MEKDRLSKGWKKIFCVTFLKGKQGPKNDWTDPSRGGKVCRCVTFPTQLELDAPAADRCDIASEASGNVDANGKIATSGI